MRSCFLMGALLLLVPLFLSGQSPTPEEHIEDLNMKAFAVRVEHPDSALQILSRAINAAELNRYKWVEAQARAIKGQILYKYATKLDIPLARAELLLARNIYAGIPDTVNMATVNDNLSVLEQVAERFEAAMAYADSAIFLLEASSELEQEKELLGRLYNNKANIFLATARYSKARTWYEQAIRLSLAAGDTIGAYIAKENLPPILQFEGKFEEAIALYEELYEYYRSLDDKYSQVQLLNTKGAVYLRNGNYQEAEQCYQAAGKLAKQESYMMLYWDAELGLKEAALLRKKQEAKNTYLWIGAILTALSFLVYYQYYRFKKREKDHEQELAEKDREIKRKIEQEETDSRRRIIRSAYNIRMEVSKNIHDCASQPLSNIMRIVDSVSKQLILEPDLQGNLRTAWDHLNKTYEDIRDISYELRPVRTDWMDRIKLSLLALRSKEGIKTDFKFTEKAFEQAFSVEEGEKISLAACNLINNIDRHSQATYAQVTILRTDDDQMKMEIIDNGDGFDPDQPDGIGLDSSRSYVAELGGKMHIASVPGEGTSITITIPITNESSKQD